MKLKKFLALLLAMVMLFSLAACSGPAEDKDDDKTPASGNNSGTNDDTGNDDSTNDEENQDDDSNTSLEDLFPVDVYLMTMAQEGDDTTVYKYDDKGNLVQRIHYEDGEEERRYEYAYDKNGNVIKETYFREGEERNSYTYEYNKDGKVTLEVFYYKGEEESRTEYSYDAKGKFTESTIYDADGNVTGRLVATYNDAGQLIQEETYEGAELVSYIKYFYSADKLTKTITYENDVEVNAHEYLYGANTGLLNMEETYLNGVHSYRIQYFYDDNNNVEKRVSFDYISDISQYIDYSYDENGCRTTATAKTEDITGEINDEYFYQYQKMTLGRAVAEKLQEYYGTAMIVIAG